MSVQTEIDRISTAVQNAHLKVIEKGGTSAAPYLVANLPDAIDTIPEATEPKLQTKTATPSETAQTVKPDSGYDGLSQVSVGAIPDEYITTTDATAAAGDILEGKTAYVSGVKVEGSIPNKTADDLTANGAKVYIPAGYYAEDTEKSVNTAFLAMPSINVGADGLITASYTQWSGYVQSGTQKNTRQLPTQDTMTVTPGKSGQVAVESGKYTTGTVYVAGDANLVAGNIKSGVSIFGVAGSYEGSGGGGSVEACTVEIFAIGPVKDTTFYFIDTDGAVQYMKCSSTDLMMGVQLVVQGNSPLVGNTYIGSVKKPEGGAIFMGSSCYYITGDATVYIGG